MHSLRLYGVNTNSSVCDNPGLNQQLLSVVLTFCIALALCLLGRSIALRILDRRITDKLTFSHTFLNAIRFPSILWCLAAALAITIRNAAPSPHVVYWATKGIGAFTIISVSLVVAAVFVRMIAVYGERNHMPFAVAGLSRTLTNVFVLSIGFLMLLRMFEVEITPILTALGVGGLAVALALQDTLANLFAGIHILVEEPISVGDFIKLSSGEEGVVKDIGWRTTRILTGGNNMTVIPNTKITSSTLTNFNLPSTRVAVDIPILASYEADHNQIAGIALDIAADTRGVLQEPAPSVWFDPGVTPTNLQMKLVVHVPSQMDRGPVQSTIRRRLFERFREEGIPFPVVRP
jgi:small-conductance mechanosensitive channel